MKCLSFLELGGVLSASASLIPERPSLLECSKASCPGTTEKGKKHDNKGTQDFFFNYLRMLLVVTEKTILTWVFINPLPVHLGPG